MSAPAWAERYIGLPFEDHGRGPAYDCWGLARLVLAARFGRVLPDYGYDYVAADDRGSVPRAIESGLREGWQRVEQPTAGDLIVFRIFGRTTHVGLVLELPWFLHIHEGIGSAIERVDARLWARRIEGYYRYG